MTYAAVPALRADKELAQAWRPLLASKTYDFGLRLASSKSDLPVGLRIGADRQTVDA
jgi:putative acyl-CoA dehydrogenase